MKKSALILCVLFFLPVTAFAEERSTEITTTIPATYTMTIPASQDVTINAERTALSDLKVLGDLAPNQFVRISVKIEAMTNKDNKQAPTLPFTLTNEKTENWTSETWNAEEAASQKVVKLVLKIDNEAWAIAKPGRYEGKIVFTSATGTNKQEMKP